jgi:SAM-dependent methyltransferase
MAGAYEVLAADYDWMFDDDELANGRARNLPAAARLLQRISRASVVLDAACGTGVDAAVLARRGFTVWAAVSVHRDSHCAISPGVGLGAQCRLTARLWRNDSLRWSPRITGLRVFGGWSPAGACG